MEYLKIFEVVLILGKLEVIDTYALRRAIVELYKYIHDQDNHRYSPYPPSKPTIYNPYPSTSGRPVSSNILTLLGKQTK